MINEKIAVLIKTAKKLNEASITWAVGASLLLYLRGLAAEFHDIDIMVSKAQIEQAKNIFLKMDGLQAVNLNGKFGMLEFVVDGAEIDVMDGFFEPEAGVNFVLDTGDIETWLEIDGIQIPLQSLEEWKLFYGIMGRPEKVQLIEAYLYDKQR